jgi:hypothetical protein
VKPPCGKKFHGYEVCESTALHVGDRKVLLNLALAINIRFIIHGFVRNFRMVKEKIIFEPPYLFIPEIWVDTHY